MFLRILLSFLCVPPLVFEHLKSTGHAELKAVEVAGGQKIDKKAKKKKIVVGFRDEEMEGKPRGTRR